MKIAVGIQRADVLPRYAYDTREEAPRVIRAGKLVRVTLYARMPVVECANGGTVKWVRQAARPWLTLGADRFCGGAIAVHIAEGLIRAKLRLR